MVTALYMFSGTHMAAQPSTLRDCPTEIIAQILGKLDDEERW